MANRGMGGNMGATLERSLRSQLQANANVGSAVIRQQMRPLVATCGFTVAANLVTPAVQTAFLDPQGQQGSSGIVQNRSNSTFGASQTPNGVRWFLLGMGVSINSVCPTGVQAVALTAAEVMGIQNSIALTLKIGQSTQRLGRPAFFPSGVGSFPYPGNGQPVLGGMSYFAEPVIIEPQTPFQVEVDFPGTIPINSVAALAPAIEVQVWFPRIEDYSVSQAAGA
jgi:hypothetical protein